MTHKLEPFSIMIILALMVFFGLYVFTYYSM